MKKKKEKKNFAPIIAILIVILIIVVIIFKARNSNKEDEESSQENTTESYIEEIEDGIKINKSNKLNEAKVIDGLTITNIQLTSRDGMTILLADVVNNSQQKTSLKTIQITLLDQDGNELTKVTGIVNELEAMQSTQLNIGMTSDYVSAYDFTVGLVE